MERITISLDPSLAEDFDRFIQRKGYSSRSEAIRDLIRNQLESDRLDSAEAPHCIASLSYVFNHHERELSRRLTEAQHHHHDLSLSTMHVHLDHDNCLETVILRGSTSEVRAFAERVIAERGVRHGRLNLVPVELEESSHAHLHSHPHT